MHDAGGLDGGRSSSPRSATVRSIGRERRESASTYATAPAATTMIVDVRAEEEQCREVDDEGERHHAAVLGGRPLDGKHRRQNRGDDQSRELEGAMGCGQPMNPRSTTAPVAIAAKTNKPE